MGEEEPRAVSQKKRREQKAVVPLAMLDLQGPVVLTSRPQRQVLLVLIVVAFPGWLLQSEFAAQTSEQRCQARQELKMVVIPG